MNYFVKKNIRSVRSRIWYEAFLYVTIMTFIFLFPDLDIIKI